MFLSFSKRHIVAISTILFTFTLISFGAFFWFNFVSGPEYAFYQINSSIQNKDYQNFEKWSNSQSIQESYYDQIVQSFKSKEGFDPESEKIKNSVDVLAGDFVKNEIESGEFFSSEKADNRVENFSTTTRNYDIQDVFFTSPLVRVDDETYYYFSLNKTLVFTKTTEGWRLTEIQNDFDDYTLPVPQEKQVSFRESYSKNDIEIKITEVFWADDFAYNLPLTGENKIYPSEESQRLLLIRIELVNKSDKSKYANFLNEIELHNNLQSKKYQPISTGFNNSLDKYNCLYCLLESKEVYSDYLIFELKETDLNNLKLNYSLVDFELKQN
jgi:hypothetical protein